jgi:hypothetical protein
MPEPINKLSISMAWLRAMGQCECTAGDHGHEGRCPNKLNWKSRSKKEPGGWDTRMKNPAGPDRAENWEILCIDCFEKSGGQKS